MRVVPGSVLLALVAVAVFTLGNGVGHAAASSDSPSPIVCLCRCCYMGDCVTIPNATKNVDGCDECTSDHCEYLEHNAVTQQYHGSDRGGKRSICLLISGLEGSVCGKDNKCKRSTSIKAQCIDRSGFFQRYSCIVWMCTAGILCGLTVIQAIVRRWKRREERLDHEQ